MSITYPVPSHVILFGGSPLLIAVCRMLRDRAITFDIYSSPRQLAEPIGEHGQTLEAALHQHGIDWFLSTDDINRDFPLITVGASTFGIGLGEAWSFSEDIIAVFGGRLLDFMAIPLPRYRGGAHYTWAILNRESKWGCCLQEVTPRTVQGEFDDGRVIWNMTYDVSNLEITPQHWFDTCVGQETEFLRMFFIRIVSGLPFDPRPPHDEGSLFFPRLKTAEQGWLNWAWDDTDICDFISAFDRPYPGAHTTIGGDTVQLRGACLHEGTYHPFAAGLIVRIDSDGALIAAKGGSLYVNEVILNGMNIIRSLKPGMRFITSQERLAMALSYRPNYTPAGDTNREQKVDHMLVGKKVTLRTLTLADVNQAYVNWMNDPEINKFLESRFQKQTMDSVRHFVQHMDESEDSYLFGIFENGTGAHVGNIKIGSINQRHGFADLGYLIGSKRHWGKGYATEAIKLASAFAFNELKLHRLHAGCYETNVGSMKALRKAGFSYDGLWIDQLLREGKREGHAFFSLLKEQYETAHS